MRKISKHLFFLALCFFCPFSRAEEETPIDLGAIHFELITIQEQLYTLNEVLTSFFNEMGELNYTILPEQFSMINDALVYNLPDIKDHLSRLAESVGDSLGSNIFEINEKLGYIDSTTIQTYIELLNLSSIVGDISTYLGSVESSLREVNHYMEIEYNMNQDMQESLDIIIETLKNMSLILDQGEQLTEMREDIFQIRMILELNTEFLLTKISEIATHQESLYNSFTLPFSKSGLQSYSFTFDYAFYDPKPNQPPNWQIDSYQIDGGASANGILQDIGQALVNILEGDSNASTMLAHLCKNLSFEKVEESQKRQEYTDQISNPIADARSQFYALWNVDENGVINIDTKYQTPIGSVGGRRTFKERFLSLFTEYQSILQRFNINELPEGKIETMRYTFGDFQVDSIELDLHTKKFSFVFESIRIIFGVIYYLSFFCIFFFCIRWSIYAWEFITKYTTSLSNT